MLAIIVTWGTRPRQVYAAGLTNMADARRMQATAKSVGYRDATIVDQEEFERQQAERRLA